MSKKHKTKSEFEIHKDKSVLVHDEIQVGESIKTKIHTNYTAQLTFVDEYTIKISVLNKSKKELPQEQWLEYKSDWHPNSGRKSTTIRLEDEIYYDGEWMVISRNSLPVEFEGFEFVDVNKYY